MYFSKLLVSDIIEFAVFRGANKNALLQTLGIQMGDELVASFNPTNQENNIEKFTPKIDPSNGRSRITGFIKNFAKKTTATQHAF